MRSPTLLIAVGLVFAMAVSFFPGDSLAQPAPAPSIVSGSDLLAAVNSLRASNGLPAYNANPILMQIAQAQADYMAATGGVYGHTGPGGTTPKDRAIAAGYSAVFFSENWQAGSGLSPGGAVAAWQGDAPHLNTMLSSSLVDGGGGVSKSGSTVYYVLDAGAQGSAVDSGGTPGTGTAIPLGTPKPSQFMVPVTVSTPGPDGLVYHEVAYGQTLWSIAIAYGTKIDAIKALNNLGDIDIYPGEKLLILRGPSPVPVTATVMSTQTASPTVIAATAAPQGASPTVAAYHTPVVTATAAPARAAKGRINLTAIAIVGAALLFAALGTWAGTRRAV